MGRAPRILVISPAEGAIGSFFTALERAEHLDGVAALLRRPGLALRAYLAEAERLAELARARSFPWLAHARVDLASALGGGVHLPERGLRAAEARALLAPSSLVGVSRHDVHGLRHALAAGADYATLSPFAATPGKGPALGAVRFAAIRASVPSLPVLALGGVDGSNLADALAAGADGVALIRAVADADDPAATLDRLVQALARRLTADPPKAITSA